VRFHQLHDADGGRIRQRNVCARDGAEVPREHIVRGFEIEPGRHVQVLPEELAALAPAPSRGIDIEAFVDQAEIDPTFYGRTYYLAPAAGAARAYALLLTAMAALGKVAIAHAVIRHEPLFCVLRPSGPPGRPGTALMLTRLGYADEVIPASEIEGLPGPEVQPGDRELRLAERLVEARSERFVPERYHDEHREKVLAFVRRKAEGGEAPVLPAPAPEAPGPPLELVEALEASLKTAA
jgi:DNA end-binding protein Ku